MAGLFLVLVHLLYARTWQAGFVSDFTGFLHRIDGASLQGVWDCFGFPALHQVTNFFLFCFVKWFGVGGIGWYFVSTSLHVANAFLGFVLAKKIFEKFGHEHPETPAFIASLLFLLSPYQVEVVVWRVCFNFLFCTLTMLGSLLLWVKYCEAKQRNHLLWSLGLFVVALFTFELAVALPFVLAAMYFLSLPKATSASRGPEVAFSDDKGKKKVIKHKWFLPLVYFIPLIAYFLLNKLLLGGWAGHYGEATHLNFDLRLIASNCLKYLSKYLLWWREWPHNEKEALVLFFEKPVVAWSGLAVFALTLAGYGTLPALGQKLRLVGHAWLLFFLALAPVANLYVAYILHGENDRYGYFASLFFCIGLVAVFCLFPRLLRNGLFLLWLASSVFFTHKMTERWQVANCITAGLLSDFRWQEASEVYVLASPDNYEGIPIFKDFSRENLAIKHALKYLADKPAKGSFYQVAQFNLTTSEDGFTARRDDDIGHFHLQFHQWGNWWWRYGMGLGDYQTEQYRFRTDGNGCRVELKHWPPKERAVFIVAQGNRWEEL